MRERGVLVGEGRGVGRGRGGRVEVRYGGGRVSCVYSNFGEFEEI